MAGAAVGAIAGTIAAFGGVFFKSATSGDWLSFLGSLLGSLLAVGGAAALIFLQQDATRRRHHRTIRVLIGSAKGFVANMRKLMDENAAEGRAYAQLTALARSMTTLKRATDRLMAESPAIAWLAGAFAEAGDFARDVDKWAALQKVDWRPSAKEMVDYADDVLTKSGLVLDRGDEDADLLTQHP